MMQTLAELAKRVDGEVRGDPNYKISGVASVESAGPNEIAYVSTRAFLKQHMNTSAGALIISREEAGVYTGNALIVANPKLCFSSIANLFYPPPAIEGGIHATAVIDDEAVVAESAYVGPLAVIESGAIIHERCLVGPGCYVGNNVVIGEDSRLLAHVIIYHDCVIGKECILNPAAVIGSDGFGYANDGSRWVRIPQSGRVVIGDRVEIGANTCIDRGTMDDTVIGDGAKLDNMIHIAHNVRIGEDTAMAAFAGVAGSATIGKRCTIGGQAGIDGHLEITDDVHVTATSLVTKSITGPGVYSSAIKAGPADEWRKNVARLRNLDEMARRLRVLEQLIQRLTKERSI